MATEDGALWCTKAQRYPPPPCPLMSSEEHVGASMKMNMWFRDGGGGGGGREARWRCPNLILDYISRLVVCIH